MGQALRDDSQKQEDKYAANKRLVVRKNVIKNALGLMADIQAEYVARGGEYILTPKIETPKKEPVKKRKLSNSEHNLAGQQFILSRATTTNDIIIIRIETPIPDSVNMLLEVRNFSLFIHQRLV
ncbi:hypothetical protein FQN57_002592 [Myotisia sp. PD_48]|nr:hypothetical protein FQN57_002592 [Myotisia sp. PD_48]